MADSAARLEACHDCDLLLRLTAARERLCCPRCGAVLYEKNAHSPQAVVALLLAGLVVFLIANLFPVVQLEVAGNRSAATLWQTALALKDQDMSSVALLVLFTGVVMPALVLGSMLYLQLPLLWGRSAPGFAHIVRLQAMVHPWCMVEVFLLGVLVSLVKLVKLASVHPGVGLWAFFGLILLMATNASRFDAEDLWERRQACRNTE